MSDSLKDTVIVIACVLTISMNPEPLDDEDEVLEAFKLPAVDPEPEPEPEPAPELELPLELELELEFEPEPPAEIVSPGETAETLTTVPVAGA
jgi:hypothetical protein